MVAKSQNNEGTWAKKKRGKMEGLNEDEKGCETKGRKSRAGFSGFWGIRVCLATNRKRFLLATVSGYF
jgi:hypothetical protein